MKNITGPKTLENIKKCMKEAAEFSIGYQGKSNFSLRYSTKVQELSKTQKELHQIISNGQLTETALLKLKNKKNVIMFKIRSQCNKEATDKIITEVEESGKLKDSTYKMFQAIKKFLKQPFQRVILKDEVTGAKNMKEEFS